MEPTTILSFNHREAALHRPQPFAALATLFAHYTLAVLFKKYAMPPSCA
jgi:hypothetical protein